MRGRLDARRTLKSLVADLRLYTYITAYFILSLACEDVNMSHPVLFYRKRIKLPWTTPHSRTQFLSYYLSMDDLTSGFNIGTNYTLNPQFNEMTGFTEKDVRDMLEYYSTTCPFNHSVDELIELIAFLLRNADHQRNA